MAPSREVTANCCRTHVKYYERYTSSTVWGSSSRDESAPLRRRRPAVEMRKWGGVKPGSEVPSGGRDSGWLQSTRGRAPSEALIQLYCEGLVRDPWCRLDVLTDAPTKRVKSFSPPQAHSRGSKEEEAPCPSEDDEENGNVDGNGLWSKVGMVTRVVGPVVDLLFSQGCFPPGTWF